MKAMKQTNHLIAVAIALGATRAHAGLPQIDDTTWYSNQLLWLAVSFIALYAAVSLFIAPTIKGILAQREDAIGEAIREAEKAKSAAESTRGTVESASQSARLRAAEIMAKAQAENNSDAAQAIAKLDHELARKADNAAASLEDAMKKAESGIAGAAQDLAVAMTERLLGAADLNAADAPKLKLAVKR